MKSVHDWQSYQASVLAQSGGGTSILYRPCRELPARVTDCAPDDSVKDHERIAVISRPRFTGLYLFAFFKTSLSCCLGQLFVSAFTGEKTLLIKGFTRTIPAKYLFEQMSGHNGHGLVSRHLCFLFLFVIEVPIKTAFFNQRQSDCLQDFSQQPPALFADLVPALKGTALSGFEIETSITHQLSPVVKIRKRAGFREQSGKIFFRDDLWCRWRNQGIVLPQLQTS